MTRVRCQGKNRPKPLHATWVGAVSGLFRPIPASAIRKSAMRCGVLMLCLAAVSPTIAQESPSGDLADLSLEQLSNIEITSVSKRAERLADAPTSIYVIT